MRSTHRPKLRDCHVLQAVFAAILLMSWSHVLAHGANARVALVVGVSKYAHAPSLPNTLNDAKDMSAALKRLGFDVETVLDPGRSALEAAVRRYGDRSAGADASVFYYSGHALETNGRNWLLPATVNLSSERDLRFEAVDLNVILEQTDGGARVSIVFLDACRDNPFVGRLASSGRGLSRGLARLEATASGVLVAYSTAPGQIALDSVGARKNSPFTAALLNHLEIGGLEVKSLLSRVTKEVVEETKGKQRPWQNSSLEGEFYFLPSPATPAAAQPNSNFEGVFWDSIRVSNDPAGFVAYLVKFPNGVFAELAQIRLAALQTAKEPLNEQPQQPSSPPPTSPDVVKVGEPADKQPPVTQPRTKSALAYINSGNAYRTKNDLDRAIADYDEAIRLDPTYAVAYNGRGVAFRDRKDYDRAIADFSEAARLDPNFALAYSNRGLAYGFRRDFDRAIADFNEAIRVSPKFAMAYHNRGTAYREKKDYDRAVADYNEAIRIDPNFALAHFNRARMYGDRRDYNAAIADYNEAIRIKPVISTAVGQLGETHINAYVGRGNAYRALGNYDRSIADYNEALRIDPDYAVAYNERGLAYRLKGDDNKAIADYSEAIRVNSMYPNPYN